MTTGTPAPHAYVCPACGRKHGADLSAMEGHPEVHGKVHCMGCHALLWLSLHADGTPKCELFEAHRHDVQAGLTPAAAPATRSSPMLPAVLAAAVVAAAVSFLVGRASDDAPAATPAPASLQPRVEALEAELARATKVADAARAELARNVAELAEGGTDEAGMKALDTTAADEQAAALQAALDALAAEQKSLHGRIEANYAALRVLGKQVKALEEAAAAK